MIVRPEAGARVLLLSLEGSSPALLGQLQAEGYDVAVAQSPTEAIRMIARLKFHALVAEAPSPQVGCPG